MTREARMDRQTFHACPALVLLVLSGVVVAACVRAEDANAERAYYELEDDLLSRAALAKALATVERARQANPRDPWAYATQSYAVLAAGYEIGDRSSLKSYDEAAVDRALGLAAKAVELDPSTSMFHAHLARIQIIKGEYETAFAELTTAHDLDPDSFYPWFLLGIVAEKRHNRAEAELYYLEADQRKSRPSHARSLNIRRQNLARMAGDVADEERLLKEAIELAPTSPYVYGNYATFLMRQKRYEEAIRNWETAVRLGPYRRAVEQLEKAKQLKRSQEDAR
jgi:tetratricopeptide (TPR) repeat protein